MASERQGSSGGPAAGGERAKGLAKTPPIQAKRCDLARTTSAPFIGATTASPIPGPSTAALAPLNRHPSGMSSVAEDDARSGTDSASTPASSPACSPGATFIPLHAAPIPPPAAPVSSGPITSPPSERGAHIRLSTTPLFPSPLAQALVGGEDPDDDEAATVETLELAADPVSEDVSGEATAVLQQEDSGPTFEGLEGDETIMVDDTTPTGPSKDKGKRSSRDALGLRISPGVSSVAVKDKMRIGSPLRRMASISDSPEGSLKSASSASSSPHEFVTSTLPLMHPPASVPSAHVHRRRSLYSPQAKSSPIATGLMVGSTGEPLSTSPSPLMTSDAPLGSSIPRQTSPVGYRKSTDGGRLSVSGRGAPPQTTTTGASPSLSSTGSGSAHSRHTSLSSNSGASRRNSLIFGSSPTRPSGRSALSAALATNASTAPPAPAPGEAMKIQRVPTSVRLAQDLRPSGSTPSSPIAAFSNRPLPFETGPTPPVPPTPMATRAHSPVDSSSESSRGQPILPSSSAPREASGWAPGSMSQSWIEGGSAGGSTGTSLASPIAFGSSVPTSATHAPPQTAGSGSLALDSAFAPVFPFASRALGSSGARASRDRSRSVFSASSEASAEGSTSLWGSRLGVPGGAPSSFGAGEDVGSSPATQVSSLSPSGSSAAWQLQRGPSSRAVSLGANAFQGGGVPGAGSGGTTDISRRLSTSVNERRGLASHRLSAIPPGGGPSTEEFAKIIMQSRTAKINKWRASRPGSSEGVASVGSAQAPPPLSKASAGSLGAAEGSRLRLPSSSSDRRKGIPDFGSLGVLPSTPAAEDQADPLAAQATADEETEVLSRLGDELVMGGPGAEIEWVDWLDDYHRMKAAKMKMEEDEDKRKSRMIPSANASQLDLTEPASGPSVVERGEGGERALPVEEPRQAAPLEPPSELGPEPVPEGLAHLPVEALHTTTTSIGDSHTYFSSADGGRPRRLSMSSLLGRGRGEAVRPSGSPVEPSSAELRRAGTSPIGKRKKNFNLGRKIDEWWTAVRSSFAGDEPRTPSSSGGRPLAPAPASRGAGAPERRSFQQSFAAPVAIPSPSLPPAAPVVLPEVPKPSVAPLRNATSSIDLPRPAFSTQAPPSGALAPAARIAPAQSGSRLGPPPAPPRTATSNSGSSQGSEEQTSAEAGSTRRRNPNLTLKLDTMAPADFSDVFKGFREPGAPASQMQQPVQSAPAADTRSSVNKPKMAPSESMQRLGLAPRSEATPSLTPGGIRLWDQTPGLVFGDPFRRTATPPATEQTPHPSAPAHDDSPHDAAFSLHTIQQHIRFRLATAKASCDRELKGIVKEITSYVEAEGLNVREQERLVQESADSNADSADVAEVETEADSQEQSEPMLSPPRKQSALPPRRPLSRTLSVPAEGFRRDGGRSATSDSDPGSQSGSAPISRKSSAHGRGRDGSATKRHPSGAIRRAHLATHRADSPFQGRSVSGSSHHGDSATSSRSNSRSRSPLPPRAATRGSPVLEAQPEQHSSGVSTIGPDEESFYSSLFVQSLQELSSIAAEVIDTPVGALTAKPHACAAVIHRIQRLGKLWDAHPEWPSRGWYVRVLLSVAGLSRVLEWWDAEKGFWDFAPEDDDDSQEIHFVANREEEESHEQDLGTAAFDSFALPPAEQYRGTEIAPTEMPTSPLDTTHSFPLPLSPLATTTSPKADQNLDQTFKTAIELARNETILAEVSLDEAAILYLNAAWTKVTGLDPQEVIGIPIGDLIDKNPDLFNQANQKLMEDVGNTVELQFTIKISLCHSETEEGEQPTEDHFIPMTGKGMLMVDRVTGEPTHSMWILRLSTRKASETSPVAGAGRQVGAHGRSLSDPVAPVFAPIPLSTEPLLCRICEHHVPAYYFERHNETCAETHRLESQIAECNERLVELRDIGKKLRSGLDRPQAAATLEYGDVPLLMVSYVPSPLSPLNPSRPTQSLTPQHLALRAAQTAALDLIEELLTTAIEVSTPSASEDAPNMVAVETLRLLSPTSENKLAVIAHWKFASIDDPAISALAEDCMSSARAKAGIVNRMRNTILYAERIRVEWEAKAQQALAETKQSLATSSPMPKPGPEEIERSNSAPPAESSEHPAVATRPASVQGLRPTDHAETLRPPVTTPELSTVSADLKGLGFFNAPHPSNGPSPLASPMRSPRLLPSNATSRRGSGQLGETPGSSTIPLSPRIPSAVPKKTAASIKDFDMIKPISKGAFGQVWLAKKKTTGQYYAIKILKKQDMIAKNQILNVKSERKILMNQSDSDFVVKLYYTFSSRDHLYLVMEYLNGGDCASLIKTLGELPEDWARNYVAEVVLGLEYLHSTDVIHRDLKPDNLLIDSHGHLKLTDFGLSKIGLLGRQATGAHPANKHMSLPNSLMSSYRDRGQDRRRARVPPMPGQGQGPSGPTSRSGTPDSAAPGSLNSSYFLSHGRSDSMNQETPSETSSRTSEAPTQQKPPFASFASPLGSQVTGFGSGNRSSGTETHRPFFGTPDYLAPETILGFDMGETVDWWALGVICYEFIHGFPPFNDDTPDKVFENIVQHRLHFPDPDISPEARDFIERLLHPDPTKRLGFNGASEVKAHAFLAPIDWPNLFKEEPSFVPRLDDPEATDYFDPRGASELVFRDDDDGELPVPGRPLVLAAAERRAVRDRSETEPTQSTSAADDFGLFNYKNLPVLERENEEVIRKLKGDQPPERPGRHARHMSFAGQLKQPLGPASPADSASSSGHSGAPRRPGLPHTSTGPLGHTASAPVIPAHSPTHSRRPSEHPPSAVQPVPEEAFGPRPSSVPPRARSASFSGTATSPPRSDMPLLALRGAMGEGSDVGGLSSASSSPRRPFRKLPPAAMQSPPNQSPASKAALALHGSPKAVPPPGERTVDCLIAEDNPISSKILETILARLGCRCVVVANGEEAISCAMGDIQFDVMFFDLLMPIIEGQDAARMIKSTQNPNMRTPIVAVTSFESYVSEQGTLFAAVLAKPVQKSDLLSIFKKLGFQAKPKTSRAARGSKSGSGDGEPVLKPRKDSVELLKRDLPPVTSQKGPLAGDHLRGRPRAGTSASASTESSGPGHSRQDSTGFGPVLHPSTEPA